MCVHRVDKWWIISKKMIKINTRLVPIKAHYFFFMAGKMDSKKCPANNPFFFKGIFYPQQQNPLISIRQQWDQFYHKSMFSAKT